MVKTAAVLASVLALLSGSATGDMVGPTRETEIAAHRPTPPFQFTLHGKTRGSGRHAGLVVDDLYHYVDAFGYGAFRLSDCSQLWQKRFLIPHRSAGLACNGRTLFVAAGNGRLFAAAPRSGKTLWSIPLPAPAVVVAADFGTVYCEIERGKIAALDAATHRVRWKFTIEASPTGEGPTVTALITNGGRVLAGTSEGRVVCLDAARGAILWTADAQDAPVGFLVVQAGTVYSTTGKSLTALLTDGTRIWDVQENSIVLPGVAVGFGLAVIQTGNGFLRAFSVDTGAPAWEARAGPSFGGTPPILNRGRILVCSDGALVAYTVEGRRLWSESMGAWYDGSQFMHARWDGLLLALGSGYLSVRTQDSPEECRSPSEVNADMELLRDCIASHRKWDAKADDALKLIARSREPRAVQFMTEQLADPEAPTEIRRAAFINLAETGGKAGLAAVLSARGTGRTISAIQERVCPELISQDTVGKYDKRTGCRILDLKSDEKGRSWALVQSELLGFYDDLWVARVDNGKCVQVLFTGINQRELGSTDWLARFAGNPELSKDSDGDGWTDLIEKRLGTAPNRIDSDSDGVKDSQDRNPLAAPRELNEREQILAAAFGARYCFYTPHAPALVVFPEGIAPFELAGRDWVVIPRVSEEAPLNKTAVQGTSLIRFGPPSLDFFGQHCTGDWQDGSILWSPDGKRAKLHINDSFGNTGATGHDIELRKIDGKWVVIGIDLRVVS